MTETIRQVEHYSASIANKVGEGARVLGALRDAGVNLIALWGYPRGAGKATLEFIPENGAAFTAAAKINVGALHAVCAGSGRFGGVSFLPQKAVGKAARALGAT